MKNISKVLKVLKQTPTEYKFLFADEGGLAIRNIWLHDDKLKSYTIPITKEELEDLATFIKQNKATIFESVSKL